MLDGKVLTAVLASLAAIGAAINGGGLDAEQVKSNSVSAPGEFTFNDVIPDSLSGLDQFIQNPEPENEVKAVLVAEDIGDEKLKAKGAEVSAANFTSIGFGGKTLSSDESVVIYGFRGEVMPDDTTEIRGTGSGIVTSGVNVSGRTRVSEDIETGMIDIKEIERSRIKLDEATGTVSSGSGTTDIAEGTKISINSFSGNARVYPGNSTVVLDGKVDRLDAGEFSFGS